MVEAFGLTLRVDRDPHAGLAHGFLLPQAPGGQANREPALGHPTVSALV